MPTRTSQPSDLYAAKAVKAICGVTSRKLDYWIDTGVLYPVKVSRPRKEEGKLGRKTFLFSFENLVQVRTIFTLRNSGVSLQEIRLVVAHLRKKVGDDWQGQWLLTNGNKVFSRDDAETFGGTVEELGSGNHQLAFTAVAMSQLVDDVQEMLVASESEPVDLRGRSVRRFRISVDAPARPAQYRR